MICRKKIKIYALLLGFLAVSCQNQERSEPEENFLKSFNEWQELQLTQTEDKYDSDSLTKNILSSKTNESSADTVKKVSKGEIAPDFKLRTISGSKFQLSSIKEKFIILDFWGSWCVPCLKDLPKMKEYYKKYKSKLEIIGIAYLDTERNWKLTVKKYKLNWTNVIIDEPSNTDLTFIYGVESFPTKIIVGKDMEIIGKYGTSDEFYKKIDELVSSSK